MKGTLADFPLVYAGLKEIFYDQPVPGEVFNVEIHNPELHEWLPCFIYTEKILTELKGQPLKEYYPSVWKSLDDWVDLPDHVDSSDWLVYMPINDSDQQILKLHGCSDIEVWAVTMLFNEFFDGYLRRLLTIGGE